jgi:hypothetical protein
MLERLVVGSGRVGRIATARSDRIPSFSSHFPSSSDPWSRLFSIITHEFSLYAQATARLHTVTFRFSEHSQHIAKEWFPNKDTYRRLQLSQLIIVRLTFLVGGMGLSGDRDVGIGRPFAAAAAAALTSMDSCPCEGVPCASIKKRFNKVVESPRSFVEKEPPSHPASTMPG